MLSSPSTSAAAVQQQKTPSSPLLPAMVRETAQKKPPAEELQPPLRDIEQKKETPTNAPPSEMASGDGSEKKAELPAAGKGYDAQRGAAAGGGEDVERITVVATESTTNESRDVEASPEDEILAAVLEAFEVEDERSVSEFQVHFDGNAVERGEKFADHNIEVGGPFFPVAASPRSLTHSLTAQRSAARRAAHSVWAAQEERGAARRALGARVAPHCSAVSGHGLWSALSGTAARGGPLAATEAARRAARTHPAACAADETSRAGGEVYRGTCGTARASKHKHVPGRPARCAAAALWSRLPACWPGGLPAWRSAGLPACRPGGPLRASWRA